MVEYLLRVSPCLLSVIWKESVQLSSCSAKTVTRCSVCRLCTEREHGSESPLAPLARICQYFASGVIDSDEEF
jgi:hypothetical protein